MCILNMTFVSFKIAPSHLHPCTYVHTGLPIDGDQSITKGWSILALPSR